jgi:hypothetical protein
VRPLRRGLGRAVTLRRKCRPGHRRASSRVELARDAARHCAGHGFFALSVACYVFARRALGLRQRVWAAICLTVGVGIQILGAAPNLNSNFIPLWIAMVIGFGWASVQLARLWGELANT